MKSYIGWKKRNNQKAWNIQILTLIYKSKHVEENQDGLSETYHNLVKRKSENPQCFPLSLKGFLLDCISCNPQADKAKIEHAFTHLENNLHDKSRHWLEKNVSTKIPLDDEGTVRDRTVET